MVDAALFGSHLQLTIHTILGNPGVTDYVTLRWVTKMSNVMGRNCFTEDGLQAKSNVILK